MPSLKVNVASNYFVEASVGRVRFWQRIGFEVILESNYVCINGLQERPLTGEHPGNVD